MDEQQRITAACKAHHLRIPTRFFVYEDPAHVCRVQERHFQTLRLLARAGYQPLSESHILDIGCDDGRLIRQFLQWGASPQKLAGIDLRSEPIERGRRLNPHLDLRIGSAAELPWHNSSFDLVCQQTVFTSILDPAIRRQVASEMDRVLRPDGAVLWYDFIHDNPWNHDVRGVHEREIRTLFPGFDLHLQRITLASPIARRLPKPLLPVLYPLLSAIPPLRTHWIGLLVKRYLFATILTQ